MFTVTAGLNLDPDGYELVLDGTPQGPIGINASRSFDSLTPGGHAVDLTDIAPTCHPHVPLPRLTQVPAGDTVGIDLRVECLGIPDDVQLAFTRIRLDPPSSHIDGAAGDGGGAIDLTAHAAFDRDPAWSPDGQTLAFSRESTIHLINEAGTERVALVEGAAPTWSPDGSIIAFHRAVAGGIPGCEGTIFVVGRDGTGVRELTRGVAPAWSPDGTRIAFERCVGEGSEIFTIDVATGVPVNLTRGGLTDREPAWSSDGARIAFRRLNRAETSGYDLWVMNADGSAQERVIELPGPQIAPAWTSDGRLLFASGSIHVVSPDGSGLRQLTGEPSTTDASPAWRPRP